MLLRWSPIAAAARPPACPPAAASLQADARPDGAAQVHFPWRLPWCPQALTRGEILSALLFLSLNLAVIWARMHRSLGRGAKKLEFLATSSKTQLMWNTFQGVEVWAHTFGVLAVMNGVSCAPSPPCGSAHRAR